MTQVNFDIFSDYDEDKHPTETPWIVRGVIHDGEIRVATNIDSTNRQLKVEFIGWKSNILTISGSKFSELKLRGCKFNKILIEDSCFKKSLTIGEANGATTISLNNVEGDCVALGCGKIFYFSTVHATKINITSKKCKSVKLEDTFEDGIINIFPTPESAHNGVNISMWNATNLRLNAGTRIGSLLFVGKSSGLKVSNTDQPIGKLTFHKFETEKNLILKRLKIDKKFGIFSLVDSDLSKVTFYECNLNVKDFFIKNCFLIGCESFETDWPVTPNLLETKINGEDIGFETLRAHSEQKINYLRQLKNLYEKGGDISRASEYRKHELIELEQNCKGWIDKIPLLAGSYSSNHGTNWLFPILWILGLNFIFYILSVLTAPVRCEPTLCNIAFNMATSINPVHKISDYTYLENIDKVAIPWWFVWLDLALRAANSYLIFQTVRSFRKFIK